MKKSLILFVCLITQRLLVFATHIFGGELTYQFLGNNQYQITLLVYRDCGPSNTNNTGFDNNVSIGIRNADGTLFQNLSIPLVSSNVSNIPITLNDPCLTVPTNLCVEKAVYQSSVNLPFNASGYSLAYQRCCRNNSIDNISNPANSGMTLTTSVPGTDLVTFQNSSPTFVSLPPVALCMGSNFVYDSHAIDSDGDSLVYEFCDPLLGASAGAPTPSPPTSSPYNPVSWIAPYSTTYPIASAPIMNMNAQTGIISGVANQLGTYAVAMCVKEFRNGILINTIRRDYQFNVVLCDPNSTASVALPSSYSNCVGQPVTFENNSVNAQTYLWDFGVTSLQSDTSDLFEPQYTYSSPGIYTITLVTNPGLDCADTTTMSFIAVAIPEVTTIATDSVCQGDEIQLSAISSSGSQFSWFGPNSFLSSSQNPSISASTLNDSGVYFVTAHVLNCYSNLQSTQVTVIPTPIANPSYSGAVCNDGQFQFFSNASGITEFNWTGPNLFQSNLPNPILSNVSQISEGYYFLQMTQNNCISDIDSVWAEVLSEPVTSASYNYPVCFGESLELSCLLVNGAQYLWTGPNGFTSNESNPTIITTDSTNIGLYSVVLISQTCPSMEASVNVTFNQIPTLQFINSDWESCAGDEVIWEAQCNLNDATITWYGPNDSSLFFTVGPISGVAVTDSSFSGEYYVMAQLDGCKSETISHILHVNPTPSVSFSDVSNWICEGDSLIVETESSSGAVSSLLFNGQIIGQNGDFAIDNSHIGSNNGLYSAQAVLNGCYSISIDTLVTILPLPQIYSTGEAVVCEGDQLQVHVEENNVPVSAIIVGPNGFVNSQGQIFTSSAVTSDSGTYVASFFNGSCTSLPLSINIVINSNPEVSIIASDSIICFGEQIDLFCGQNYSSYQWSTGDQLNSIVVSPQNNTIFSLIVFDQNNCSGTSEINILVNHPTINIIQSAPTHPQMSNMVGGYYPLLTEFIANGFGDSFIWNFGDSSTFTFSSMPDTIYHIYNNSGYYTLTASSVIEDCVVSDTIYIQTYPLSLIGCEQNILDCPWEQIPNFVSLNGDTFNNGFWVPNQHMMEWNVKIYNRWGNLLYEITQPNDFRMEAKDMWLPTDAVPGVYYYVYSGTGVDYVVHQGKGYFEIVK